MLNDALGVGQGTRAIYVLLNAFFLKCGYVLGGRDKCALLIMALPSIPLYSWNLDKVWFLLGLF